MKNLLLAGWVLWSCTTVSAEALKKSWLTIPAGSFRPLYSVKKLAPGEKVKVAGFQLCSLAVTNREYLEFVRRCPQWRRSRVPRVFAEAGYLRHWKGDLDTGTGVADSPVNFVSWFAARAYCRDAGLRLPSMMEWEYAARASTSKPDGEADAAFQRQILAWYGQPTRSQLPPVGGGMRNCYGAYDMHGLVWEWVDDFTGVLMEGEGRGGQSLDRNLFCAAGAAGGADPRDYPAYMRFAFRSSLKASYCLGNLGFRCARGPGGKP
ncbi:formylglycine-generating enzyme family protein [bacterium]|nr:formylglycine-generating enzyme family protein [bacterium]